MPRPRAARLAFSAGWMPICCGLLAAAAHAGPPLLDQSVGRSDGGVELATRLAGLERAGLGVPVLDRRVDPHLPMAPAPAGSLGDALAASFGANRVGASELSGALYVGPTPAARDLRTLAEIGRKQVTRLDAGSRSEMRRIDSLSWPRLTEPRGLIESLLDGHGLRLQNPETLPLDVWDQGRLPPMTLSDRLTLLLIGFDLVWQASDAPRAIRLAPAPRSPSISKRYNLPKRVAWDERAFQDAFPSAVVQRRGNRVELTARVEAHERLATELRGEVEDDTPPSGGEQRLTLTVRQQPAAAVLQKLTETFSLSVRYEPSVSDAARTALTRRVDLSVSQATLAELLDELGMQVGYSLSLRGKEILIGPASAGAVD
ncbi:hypothetical protein KOR34_28100 [Posidoniimonas corsicana]|uniref:Secretin/TonB short N-terminal domain-containing protein n=1 Tax=Posidoniimonas corsicana TaxID=1938618 RepID=A0A5C5VGX4_9BACT|nr:hypothetical protein [Posidoniimonas corsicana]TWT37846.1 hypothetical protein KOR34_28100 [Posidoniimonas corsicana]